ncbi:TetR family transcriptional regulator [Siminovitchia terrae]|uniref:TetR family transcriptional regulator n=1 Tax=Siminovitchia terrae TaxID=1914933 RepID=A0ABQ4KZE5_SIMTE|nr:TetR/AcrR family transcriptional regulator [Siminovitchia terrae]GIN92557.1 TetR family transcriptional regulator [Siminovitchia terrae]GIN97408.1 TetR family transcriptional regulator [Siminovitchia terrae]
MGSNLNVTKRRIPKQNRSIQNRDKILDAGLKLFSEKGYYDTTTNEIAKVAGVSIGSLYSYFKDKDAIFLSILDNYHKRFLSFFHEKDEDLSYELYARDIKQWLKNLMVKLLDIHESVKTLNREMNIMYHSKPQVARIMDTQTERIRTMTMSFIARSESSVYDIEATSAVIVDFISTVIDRILYKENDNLDKDNIIEAAVDILANYLS